MARNHRMPTCRYSLGQRSCAHLPQVGDEIHAALVCGALETLTLLRRVEAVAGNRWSRRLDLDSRATIGEPLRKRIEADIAHAAHRDGTGAARQVEHFGTGCNRLRILCGCKLGRADVAGFLVSCRRPHRFFPRRVTLTFGPALSARAVDTTAGVT